MSWEPILQEFGEKEPHSKGHIISGSFRDFVKQPRFHLGGVFKYLLFSSLPWEMVQFDEHIFQMGLVQPPTSPCLARFHQYKSRPKPVIAPQVVPVQEIFGVVVFSRHGDPSRFLYLQLIAGIPDLEKGAEVYCLDVSFCFCCWMCAIFLQILPRGRYFTYTPEI